MTSARDSRGVTVPTATWARPRPATPGMPPEESRARPDPATDRAVPGARRCAQGGRMRAQRRHRAAARSVAGRRDHRGRDDDRHDGVPANTELTNGTIGGLSVADETSSTGAGSHSDGTAFTLQGTCIN